MLAAITPRLIFGEQLGRRSPSAAITHDIAGSLLIDRKRRAGIQSLGLLTAKPLALHDQRLCLVPVTCRFLGQHRQDVEPTVDHESFPPTTDPTQKRICPFRPRSSGLFVALEPEINLMQALSGF
jgi:hypothetical protein